MTDYIQQAKEIIEANVYMTICTVSPEGNPWVSPVFFVYDDQYNLFWVSNKDARHSQYVSNNKKVAIVIFDSSAVVGTGDGVYFESEAGELSDVEEINKVTEIWNQRAEKEEFMIKDIGEVTGSGVWRIYKAVHKTTSKLKEGEYINGQYVDKRIEIELGK